MNYEIVLVRHWYNSLWVMPGGGIKKYETPEQAAIREVREELGLDISQLDYRLGTYTNIEQGKNDVVHCFVVELDKKPIFKKRFNIEISDIEYFNLHNLPDQTSKATKNRIIEYLQGAITRKIRSWS